MKTMIYPSKLRNHILDMIYNKQTGHIGGSFSICELIAALYNQFDLINTDKLILSKGHAVPALYAVFYELGLITKEELNTFREINSPLQGHPDKNKLKYLHATTGSLGQGLSIAIGHALAFKIKQTNEKVFAILGDGELQEGQIWEAFMLAPKYKLNNLICFIDYNKFQLEDTIDNILSIENLENKIKSFNWNIIRINGNSTAQINRVLKHINEDSKLINPTCIIMDTIKGYGVSFMQTAEWHSKVPNEQEYKLAKKELNI